MLQQFYEQNKDLIVNIGGALIHRLADGME